MRTAGNRERVTGNSAPYAGFRNGCARWRVQECQVSGCGALAPAGKQYCDECTGQIAEAEEMHARADERPERMAQRLYGAAVRFEAICLAVRRRLWVFCLTGVMVGLMILALDWGDAFVEWIEAGGVR